MKDRLSSDQRLVRRMLAGEEEAFEEFFHTYFPGLYRFVLTRLNRDQAAAEEITQRALCKAILKLSSYRGEAVLFSWLCTFCRYEIAGYLKQESVHSAFFFQENPEVVAALESLLAVCERPDQVALRKEVAREVQIALQALPRRYAEVLVWKYIDGLSVKEIAGRLDLGFKAVESLLSRARQSFRDAFTTRTFSGMRAGLQELSD